MLEIQIPGNGYVAEIWYLGQNPRPGESVTLASIDQLLTTPWPFGRGEETLRIEAELATQYQQQLIDLGIIRRDGSLNQEQAPFLYHSFVPFGDRHLLSVGSTKHVVVDPVPRFANAGFRSRLETKPFLAPGAQEVLFDGIMYYLVTGSNVYSMSIRSSKS
ncbi:MAG: hypothetical protein ABIG95_05640 [Candidatus Woesearchaeota archaeon]